MTPARLLARRGTQTTDDGSAIIEFVFVAVAQRTNLAVTNAARDAGRAYATAETLREAEQRADVAVRLALDDQGMDERDVTIRVTSAQTGCDGPRTAPSLDPGAEFAVCVTRRVELPGIPSVLAGRGITSVGRYVVHVDDFREVPDAG